MGNQENVKHALRFQILIQLAPSSLQHQVLRPKTALKTNTYQEFQLTEQEESTKASIGSPCLSQFIVEIFIWSK